MMMTTYLSYIGGLISTDAVESYLTVNRTLHHNFNDLSHITLLFSAIYGMTHEAPLIRSRGIRRYINL